jgi:hypothetical protein
MNSGVIDGLLDNPYAPIPTAYPYAASTNSGVITGLSDNPPYIPIPMAYPYAAPQMQVLWMGYMTTHKIPIPTAYPYAAPRIPGL